MSLARRFEEPLLAHLRSALSGLPHANVSPWRETPTRSREIRADALVYLKVPGQSVTLLVQLKSTAFPRDIRQVLSLLRKHQSLWEATHPNDVVVPFVAAESLSEGARALLRNEGVGYFDTGGSLFIPAPGAYAFIDKPVPRAVAKSIGSLFTGRRSQVLHALLRSPGEWFGVNVLAEKAGVSAATVSQTMTALERLEWITTRGSGPAKERNLTLPGELLDAWARHVENARAPILRRYFVPALQAAELPRQLAAVCEAHDALYAVTHEIAAQRYAPFLTHVSQVRCRLLSGAAGEAALQDLNARPVREGANLTVIEAKSPGELLFSERDANVWFADPIQVYLDLLSGEGRGKEAADHLRREKIGF